MPDADAIVVEGLTRDFGKFRAVDQVSFRVRRGEIFGFLGPNGAGKSTTIRMLCGLLLPSGGRGSVAGLDVVAENKRIKQVIGYMSQRFSLYDDLTVQENLSFFGGVYGLSPSRVAQRSEEVLHLVGLSDRRHDLTGTLAGGLRQRLALASAILHQPEILFLDEPTSGVDPNSRRNFWDIIGDMAAQGVTILVTTHYLDEAEYCDRLVLIYQGRVVAQGSPQELKSSLPGQVWGLTPEPLAPALEIARQVPGVTEANIFGDSLHVNTAPDYDLVKPLAQALAAGGVKAGVIAPIAASLEDAFISYIQAAKGQDKSK
ncbi:MAG: ABC transporter ATP-binding protein [Desulfarculus sp.]|nr:ABC transporter ATP-binding protein [Desulfarculus sp.]